MKTKGANKNNQKPLAFQSLIRAVISGLIILPVILIINSCQKDELSEEIKKERISGFVQKGPFINGTQILMAELNSALEQTGKLFSTQIVSNTGEFEIRDIALSSNFVEFSASGFYFDEVKGEASASQLTLFALSDITDITSVNVNILTHLERRRVEYLINQDMSFAQAKQTAQAEILAMFGFDNSQMQESENLNITIDDEGNAILLAISVILQGNRSVAELTELLAGISGDLREDGELSDESILESLRITALNLDLSQIRQNLESRYATQGIEAAIPEFENYVSAFLSFTAGEPFASTQNAINITTTGATLTAFVNPNSTATQVTFEYGPTSEYGNVVTADQSPFEGNVGLPVQVTIGSLDPAATYHFRVKAVNEHGEFTGQNRSFTTFGEVADAETYPATNINLTSTTLNGRVNPNHLSTNVIFEYGTSIEFGNETQANQSPVSGHLEVDVNADIEDLQPGTTYFFRIKAENDLGASYSNIAEFNTLGNKPAAIAEQAEALVNTANLFGKVNPNLLATTVTFEWGTNGLFQYSATAIENPLNGGNEIPVSTEISGLQASTEYQFRVKAENELGETISQVKTFKTFNSTVTDTDGNTYTTVIIGEQEWMAQDLRTAKYADGSAIPQGPLNDEDWQNFTQAAYAIYPHAMVAGINSDEEMVESYGLLYNWYAVDDQRNICPAGWRVPSMDDWFVLAEFLDPAIEGTNTGWWVTGPSASQAMRSTRTEPDAHPRWQQPNAGATNSSMFSALPGGYRQEDGSYYYLGSDFAGFWTNTVFAEQPEWSEGVYLVGAEGHSSFMRGEAFSHAAAWPVRCVKD